MKNKDRSKLSVRARNCLARMGYGDATKKQIRTAIIKGSLTFKTKLNPYGEFSKQYSKNRNFGARTYLEVCKWAGIVVEGVGQPHDEK